MTNSCTLLHLYLWTRRSCLSSSVSWCGVESVACFLACAFIESNCCEILETVTSNVLPSLTLQRVVVWYHGTSSVQVAERSTILAISNWSSI
jgi:hypothetical protein